MLIKGCIVVWCCVIVFATVKAANSAKSSRMLHDYWLALSLCHTVSVSDVDRDATHSKADIEAQAIRRQAMGLPPAKFYDGESPDEIAFVRAAADVGYIFEGCERNVYHLRTPFVPFKSFMQSYLLNLIH